MADLHDYKEKVGSMSPNTAGFSQEGGGRAVMVQDLAVSNDPLFVINEILGYVYQAGGDYRINRRLPKAHPQFPWLYAERISEIRGMGQPTVEPADFSNAFEAKPLDEYALYPYYRYTIEFLPRPYVLTNDSKIGTATLTYTDESGNTTDYTYAKEWERYTDWEFIPQGQYITAQHGQYVFKVSGGTTAGTPPIGTPAPHEYAAGNGQLRMFFPKGGVKYRWYQVPYEYIAGDPCYIWECLGRVNQNTWDGWPAGTLLLEAVQVLNRYVPPVPRLVQTEDGSLIYAANKLCTLEFVFSFIDPVLAAAAPAAPNANVIRAGHNLVPWAHTGGWYYVASKAVDANNAAISAADNKPLYPSYPFELLWTNPGP